MGSGGTSKRSMEKIIYVRKIQLMNIAEKGEAAPVLYV